MDVRSPVVFEATPERLSRGRYLAEGVLRCIRCHSEVDSAAPGWPPVNGREGAGRILREERDRALSDDDIASIVVYLRAS